MSSSKPDMLPKANPLDGSNIDYKRIAYRALRYWYLVVLSLVISLTYVFLTNRYADRVYPITASVIVREKEDASGADLLYKNSLIDPYRNYLNEPYIIRSYPLVQEVIENLNFEVAFYSEGDIKTTEAYHMPVKVKLLVKNGSYGASLLFKAIDQHTFLISNREEPDQKKIFQYSDSLEFQGHHFIVTKTDSVGLTFIIGKSFILTFLDPISVTSSYIGRLGAEWAEEGAGVLNLSINGTNPDKEIDFMNGLITKYQQYDLDKKNLTAERTILFIRKQLDDISDSLHHSENKLQQFQITNSTEKIDEESKRLFEKFDKLDEQKTELTIRSNYYDYLEKYIRQGKNLDLVILPSSIGVSDNVLSTMVGKMIDIQIELKTYLDKGLIENPMVATGLDRLEKIKNNLQESIRSLRVTDKLKGDLVDRQIGLLEKQMNQLPITQRQYISIQRSYSLLEGMYVFLMQKMSEAGISKASNISSIQRVNPPMQGGAISPNTSRNYMFGWLIGLLIPAAGFVLVELFNHKVQSKEDIEKITSIPFVGGIGHHDTKDNLAVTLQPKSSVAESFRAIRSNLNFFTGNQIKKVFVVSSSISGEGKTFSTINLATVFAMSGRKTLIIGADMRKPKIFTDFNLTNDRGLSNYLSDLKSFQEVVQHTSVENLDVISGGPVPPNPSELLLTGRFDLLLKEALVTYDYIIIDTPPLAIVTDAFELAKHADHSVFIVRQNYTPKALLKDVDDFYRSGKLKSVSIVLNDIYKTGYGYGYSYGYSYGYGYGFGSSKKKKGYGYYS